MNPEPLRIGITNRMILGGMSGPDAMRLLNEYVAAIEAEARPTPAEALDVERNGWWHPADCTNQHNEHGNCLGDDGMVVGWRDPVEYARLSISTDKTAR